MRMGGETRACFVLRAEGSRIPSWVVAAGRQVDTDGGSDEPEELAPPEPSLF